jgi:hypothetical protein
MDGLMDRGHASASCWNAWIDWMKGRDCRWSKTAKNLTVVYRLTLLGIRKKVLESVKSEISDI